MARAPSRRPGQNRRAQYGLFASYIVTLFGIFAGLFLLVLSKADPVGFSVLRVAIGEVTRPVAATLRWTVDGIGNFDEALAAYIRAGSQNTRLRHEVEISRAKLIEADAVRQENVQLRNLLGLVKRSENIVTTASVISSSSSSTRRFARISAGTARGVEIGMPVRAAEGLVGRVVMAGPHFADVLLVTDSQSIVPVRRSTGNIAAICKGKDDGTVEIRALGPDSSPFKPGDILVTSGTGGLYGPNIPVAIVLKVGAGSTIAVPLASASRVTAVMVQRPFDATSAPATDILGVGAQPKPAPAAAAPASPAQ